MPEKLTPEQRAQRKQERRKAMVPKPYNYTVDLPPKIIVGQVHVRKSFGVDSVSFQIKMPDGKDVKLSFQSGMDYIDIKARSYYDRRVIRNKKGQIITLPYQVKTLFGILAVNGRKYKARSCCKPPDHFDEVVGRELVLKRLFKEPGVAGDLNPKEIQVILYIVLPSAFTGRRRGRTWGARVQRLEDTIRHQQEMIDKLQAKIAGPSSSTAQESSAQPGRRAAKVGIHEEEMEWTPSWLASSGRPPRSTCAGSPSWRIKSILDYYQLLFGGLIWWPRSTDSPELVSCCTALATSPFMAFSANPFTLRIAPTSVSPPLSGSR